MLFTLITLPHISIVFYGTFQVLVSKGVKFSKYYTIRNRQASQTIIKTPIPILSFTARSFIFLYPAEQTIISL